MNLSVTEAVAAAQALPGIAHEPSVSQVAVADQLTHSALSALQRSVASWQAVLNEHDTSVDQMHEAQARLERAAAPALSAHRDAEAACQQAAAASADARAALARASSALQAASSAMAKFRLSDAALKTLQQAAPDSHGYVQALGEAQAVLEAAKGAMSTSTAVAMPALYERAEVGYSVGCRRAAARLAAVLRPGASAATGISAGQAVWAAQVLAHITPQPALWAGAREQLQQYLTEQIASGLRQCCRSLHSEMPLTSPAPVLIALARIHQLVLDEADTLQTLLPGAVLLPMAEVAIAPVASAASELTQAVQAAALSCADAGQLWDATRYYHGALRQVLPGEQDQLQLNMAELEAAAAAVACSAAAVQGKAAAAVLQSTWQAGTLQAVDSVRQHAQLCVQACTTCSPCLADVSLADLMAAARAASVSGSPAASGGTTPPASIGAHILRGLIQPVLAALIGESSSAALAPLPAAVRRVNALQLWLTTLASHTAKVSILTRAAVSILQGELDAAAALAVQQCASECSARLAVLPVLEAAAAADTAVAAAAQQSMAQLPSVRATDAAQSADAAARTRAAARAAASRAAEHGAALCARMPAQPEFLAAMTALGDAVGLANLAGVQHPGLRRHLRLHVHARLLCAVAFASAACRLDHTVEGLAQVLQV